jgi:hypothetical protein
VILFLYYVERLCVKRKPSQALRPPHTPPPRACGISRTMPTAWPGTDTALDNDQFQTFVAAHLGLGDLELSTQVGAPIEAPNRAGTGWRKISDAMDCRATNLYTASFPGKAGSSRQIASHFMIWRSGTGARAAVGMYSDQFETQELTYWYCLCAVGQTRRGAPAYTPTHTHTGLMTGPLLPLLQRLPGRPTNPKTLNSTSHSAANPIAAYLQQAVLNETVRDSL